MTKRRFFGTDGMRGKAGVWPMTPEVITKLAMSAGLEFQGAGGYHSVVIGKDTRLSGYMVEASLEAGFTAMGLKVYLVGPLPTPAVALLTKSLRADLGIMVSASHNAYEDNGIKFFGPDGYKLSDEIELAIERHMLEDIPLVTMEKFGKAKRIEDAGGRYIEYAKSSFPKDLSLNGLRIVVDCAHGSGYKVGPSVLWELGAEIIPIGVSPTGLNINENCGATKVDLARETLLREKADVAVVLDGDADRIIMIDNEGHVLDGDQLLALITYHFQNTHKLTSDKVIATQMSNLGLERYIKTLGLSLVRTNVGDRYVIEAMRQHNANIGGEQSGHIILHDYTTTGDGIIAALQVLAIMQSSQKSLCDLSRIYDPVPQVTHNLRVEKKLNIQDDGIISMIERAKAQIGENGYLLVRPSGTEPVLRLMAQGDNKDLLTRIIQDLASDLQKASKST